MSVPCIRKYKKTLSVSVFDNTLDREIEDIADEFIYNSLLKDSVNPTDKLSHKTKSKEVILKYLSD